MALTLQHSGQHLRYPVAEMPLIQLLYDRVRANSGKCAQFRHLHGDTFWQIARNGPRSLLNPPNMNSAPHKGFTLVEVLLVVVIAGIIAAVAVPSVFRARDAAESAAAVAHLRTIHTNQALYRSQAGRYARLSELNAYSNNSLGKIEGSTLR